MQQINIKLLHHTPLHICAHAIRTCWQSFERGDCGGAVDKALIERVGNKFKHSSTLEHLNYCFYIAGISRACLQELARHRHASLSVKSTRYTLKELKNEAPFSKDDFARAGKFIRLTNNAAVDEASIKALNELRAVLNAPAMTLDVAKYCLPESYKTELTYTINARSLQNFLKLRTSKAALAEIAELARALYAALPSDHQYLFSECLADE